ncbi:4Fe-4S ferredoxin [SAR202 cluster bacterium AD-804-J14_MRT_500m]|nr:4Fe-4S ferredoxin [SAR202 cluster bacterium AD-804-J14_MRT_500m]
MNVSRRTFLKLASVSTLGAVACNVFNEDEFISQRPVLMPEDLVTGRDNWYATLCGQCTEAEGIVVRVVEGRAKKVQGNPIYPTNRGAHSVRCEAGLQALYHPDRIAAPMKRNGARGNFVYIGWDEGLDILKQQLDRHLGEPKSLLMITEPLRGSMANLVETFASTYGGENIAFQSMEESVFDRVIYEWLGEDGLPLFDVGRADYLLSFGVDFLGTWTSPVQFSRGYGAFRQGDGRTRGKLVHVDPRFSMSAANADQWVPISPGYEGLLALSIAQVIVSGNLVDSAVIRSMTGNKQNILDDFAPEKIVNMLGIPDLNGHTAIQTIKEIAHEFAENGSHSLAIGGGSAGAHTNGYFNLQAIYALNFLAGSVGTDGTVRMNPSAPINSLRSRIAAESIQGWLTRKDRIGKETKLVLIQGVDPVHGLPTDLGFQESLNSDNVFMVSFSTLMDDTTHMADLVLPNRVTLEDWNIDVPQPGPGFVTVGLQQPVVNPLPGISPMSFADILLRMSHELGLNPQGPLQHGMYVDVLKDQVRELHGLQRGSVQDVSFDSFWNQVLEKGGWWDNTTTGSSSAPNPKYQDIIDSGIAHEPVITGPTGPDTYNLIPFQTVSITDGRGAHLPWLQSTPDPLTSAAWSTWVEINSSTADQKGIREGDIVKIEGANARFVEAQVYVHPGIPPGAIGIPVGQGHTNGSRYAQGRGTNILEILGLPTDVKTGAFAWASTRVRITPTGRREPIPKFEGIVPAFPASPESNIIKYVHE